MQRITTVSGKPSNPDTQQPLTRRTITLACYQDNTPFFWTNFFFYLFLYLLYLFYFDFLHLLIHAHFLSFFFYFLKILNF